MQKSTLLAKGPATKSLELCNSIFHLCSLGTLGANLPVSTEIIRLESGGVREFISFRRRKFSLPPPP